MNTEWEGRCLGPWKDKHLDHWAFPLGGIGAGTICLEGQGSLSHVSLRHKMERFNEPFVFACVSVPNRPELARLIEGAVPPHKIFANAGGGLGCVAKSYGLPRFRKSEARSRFPFARLDFSDPEHPLEVSLIGWSPFTPPDPDRSSLPVAAMEYIINNKGSGPLQVTFSFHAANFLVQEPGKQIIAGAAPGTYGVSRCDRGFTIWEDGNETAMARTAAFRAMVLDGDEERGVHVDPRWFRGGWYDAQTVVWRNAKGAIPIDQPDYDDDGPPSPGGSLFVPMNLSAGEERTIKLLLSWHVPFSDLRYGGDVEATNPLNTGELEKYDGIEPGPRGSVSQHLLSEYVSTEISPSAEHCHQPWYASQFSNIDSIDAFWRENYDTLRLESFCFADSFHDSTLPAPILEALSANLSILKSPTVMRQFDGRFWVWEGCRDVGGCCFGSCSHVWNYAHAVAHLFPSLERSLRETEFTDGQNTLGHQVYRQALPLRSTLHDFLGAADGQLGGIVKIYREWRISGDSKFLIRLWPKIVASLEYCITAWDPKRKGEMTEPHHVTYDIEFWGLESLTSSFYAAALTAIIAMSEALGRSTKDYPEILSRLKIMMKKRLFNGEYYEQLLNWRDALRGPDAIVLHPKATPYHREALNLLEQEGPKYQIGKGCLSDGVIGDWMARTCGLGPVLDHEQVSSHLRSVWHYNFRDDLTRHENPQRPGYALGDEGGLLLCTWPHGGEPTLPFIYSNEVWTGIEYQVAAHLALVGDFNSALKIVSAARKRYDGTLRNPFNEYECGHFYARALSSWTLLQAYSGVRYDAVDETLVIEGKPPADGRYFLSTEHGYGVILWEDGVARLDVRFGTISVSRIVEIM